MSNFTSLEINRIEEMVKPYFNFEDALTQYEKLGLIYRQSEIEKEHAFMEEMLEFFNLGNTINFKRVNSLHNSFDYVKKGGILSSEFLYNYANFFANLRELKRGFISLNNNKFDKILDIVYDFQDYSSLENRLYESILADFTISSNASIKLSTIRKSLEQLKNSYSSIIKNCVNRYANYLSEEKEVIKNGLPSLAVKSMYKNKINGIVSDVSNTGNTIFIIPIEILNLENKILELKKEEEIEIQRILEEFTKIISSRLDEIEFDYKYCLKLDSLYARVSFGLSYKGSIAKVSEDIYLPELGILMIEESKLVRNSLYLGGNNSKILVISGPNAGGKTVFIKAIALACYMNQRLLMVDCLQQARLKVFDNIFFISGDNQSIIDNLSTFSSHIAMINDSLNNITKNSLLIIDEIGQGTSPNDGEAIGVGVIKLVEKIGLFSILTSHYEGIKNLALSDSKILTGAMIFDENTIAPTFKFKEGLIGKSYALEVAKNIGFNNDVLAYAKKYLSDVNSSKQNLAMDKLSKLQLQNEKLKEKYNLKLQELEKLSNRRKEAILALSKEKQNIAEKANKKIESLVEQELEKIELAYKANKINLNQLAQIKNILHNITKKKEENKSKPKSNHVFLIGDKVKVISMDNIGYITSLNLSKKTLVVNLEGVSIKTKFDDVIYIPNIEKVEKPLSNLDKMIVRKSSVPLECNLIGLYEKEAYDKLDKYMDDVILAKYHQVRIIHGFGSGILRKMVQNYLSKNKNVESFRPGGEHEGGLGATVVYLK